MSVAQYPLPFTKNYIRHWGIVEAIRELFQNQLDSDAAFEYSINMAEDRSLTLSLTSRNITLSPKTLLLGATTKADAKDKIGSFGEGYKMALLVLTRENRKVTVKNGEYLWTPEFVYSNQYGDDILVINSELASERNNGITYVIENIDSAEMDQIKMSNLHMDPDIGETINTSFGRILLNQKGKLYVNGLFVCKTELEYGYDMKPEYLRLERDRQTVDSFDLRHNAKSMWFETDRYELIADGIEKEFEDFSLAQYSSTKLVKEACYNHFIKKHPGKIAVGSQAELDKLVRDGLTNTVFIGGNYYSQVSGAQSFASSSIKSPDPVKPIDILTEFMIKHKHRLGNKAVKDFNKVMKEAQGWQRGNTQTYEPFPFDKKD